jgi:hypothetical protein
MTNKRLNLMDQAFHEKEENKEAQEKHVES